MDYAGTICQTILQRYKILNYNDNKISPKIRKLYSFYIS